MTKFLFRLIPILAGALATLAIGVAATGWAAYYYLQPGLPSAETMRDVELQIPLRVYSRDGRLIAQLGEKRRTPIQFGDIPEVVVNAFWRPRMTVFLSSPGSTTRA